jgi:cytochrome bd-type quinol oxidase subunit 2
LYFFLRTSLLIRNLCNGFFKELKTKMKNILKNRLALSTVVTTLIILVVSVLLAGVVTYFAINVTSTRVQEEALSLSYQHIWVASNGSAVGAIVVTNTGGRDVVINKIAVRGQECSTLLVDDSADPGTDLTYPSVAEPTGNATAPIVLPSGNTISIYVTSPDSVGTQDIGLTVAFTVFTSQAMYYKETNVQAAP